MKANALIIVGEEVHEIEESGTVEVMCLSPFVDGDRRLGV